MTPRTSIFIVSYAHDFPWLVHCLRSIGKFCSGFSDVTIVVPTRDAVMIQGMNLTRERVHYHTEYGDGHLWHLWKKLTADEFTDADYLLFVDSDCVFNRKVTPEYFFMDGVPYLPYTPYSKLTTVHFDGQKKTAVPWQPGVESALKHPVEFEFMRRHPMCFSRSLLKSAREHLEKLHNMPTENYVMNVAKRGLFSEFNYWGAYAYYHQPESLRFYNTEVDGALIPPACITQFWSHKPPTDPENQQKLAAILK